MPDLDVLVQQTVAGDSQAWRTLQGLIQPTILAIARAHRGLRGKGLASLPDDLADVVAATLERLARSDYQNLRRYLERQAQADASSQESFDGWLYHTVDFVIREHLRSRFGRAPRASELPPARPRPSKRDLQSQAGRLDEGELDRAFLRTMGLTARVTVSEIFRYIESDFTADEAQALRLYYAEDGGFAEIARALNLADDKAAERLIRRLNARLRYRFVDREPEPQ